jgi:hypothetical protein
VQLERAPHGGAKSFYYILSAPGSTPWACVPFIEWCGGGQFCTNCGWTACARRRLSWGCLQQDLVIWCVERVVRVSSQAKVRAARFLGEIGLHRLAFMRLVLSRGGQPAGTGACCEGTAAVWSAVSVLPGWQLPGGKRTTVPAPRRGIQRRMLQSSCGAASRASSQPQAPIAAGGSGGAVQPPAAPRWQPLSVQLGTQQDGWLGTTHACAVQLRPMKSQSGRCCQFCGAPICTRKGGAHPQEATPTLAAIAPHCRVAALLHHRASTALLVDAAYWPGTPR